MVPLLQHVAAAANRVGAVITAVPTIRNDADNGQRVQERIERLVQMDFARFIVYGDRLVHHGQIALAGLAVRNAVDRVGHIMRRERLAVGELRVRANGERPREAVVTTGVCRREVVFEAHVGRRGQKRGLDKRLMNMLAAAPGDERVETSSRLAARRHGDRYLRGVLFALHGGSRIRVARIRVARASAQYAAEAHRSRAHACYPQKRSPGEALHRDVLPSAKQSAQLFRPQCAPA